MQQAIRNLLIELFSRYGLPLKLDGYEVDEFEATDHPVLETSEEQFEVIKAMPPGELEERARLAITSGPPHPDPDGSWQDHRSWPSHVEFMVEREIRRLLPTRYRYFDTECIYDDRDYAGLLLALAKLTDGQWQPQNVASHLSEDRKRAFLKWDDPLWPTNAGFREAMFYQTDDWVSMDFDDVIKSLGTYLPGTFVYLPSGDQCSRVVYLPHHAAAELTSLLNHFARLAERPQQNQKGSRFSMGLCNWDLFARAGVLERLQEVAGDHYLQWHFDHSDLPAPYASDPPTPFEGESEEGILINWNALLNQRLDHLEPPPPSPSGYELSSEDHLPALKAALEMLLWIEEESSATVFVPFAPSDNTYAFDLLHPDGKTFWVTITTNRVLLEWQSRSAEYRQYARQRFEQIRDPNVGSIDRDWFVAALVDLASQSVRYGLPVLISATMSGK